jgi:hypothetical protein
MPGWVVVGGPATGGAVVGGLVGGGAGGGVAGGVDVLGAVVGVVVVWLTLGRVVGTTWAWAPSPQSGAATTKMTRRDVTASVAAMRGRSRAPLLLALR